MRMTAGRRIVIMVVGNAPILGRDGVRLSAAEGGRLGTHTATPH